MKRFGLVMGLGMTVISGGAALAQKKGGAPNVGQIEESLPSYQECRYGKCGEMTGGAKGACVKQCDKKFPNESFYFKIKGLREDCFELPPIGSKRIDCFDKVEKKFPNKFSFPAFASCESAFKTCASGGKKTLQSCPAMRRQCKINVLNGSEAEPTGPKKIKKGGLKVGAPSVAQIEESLPSYQECRYGKCGEMTGQTKGTCIKQCDKKFPNESFYFKIKGLREDCFELPPIGSKRIDCFDKVEKKFPNKFSFPAFASCESAFKTCASGGKKTLQSCPAMRRQCKINVLNGSEAEPTGPKKIKKGVLKKR